MGLFKPAPFGVDLGGGSIKTVQIKGRKVASASYMDIPHEIRTDESRLSVALHEYFKEIKMTGKPVIVQVLGQLAFVRTVNLPPMPNAELRDAVKWEIKRQIPYPVEEAIYDYVAVEMAEGIAVTFASAPKKDIQKHILPFKEAGVNVVAVDISPLCLMRALKPETPGNIIMLDIGAVSTEINIVKNKVLRLTRTVEIGGDNIIHGLMSDGLSPSECQDILTKGTEEELRRHLDEFLREVLRSMDYYQANFKEKAFSEMILTGGVAINPTVKGFFQHMLDMPVKVPNPFEGMTMADETIRPLGPRFSVAVGLGRRAA